MQNLLRPLYLSPLLSPTTSKVIRRPHLYLRKTSSLKLLINLSQATMSSGSACSSPSITDVVTEHPPIVDSSKKNRAVAPGDLASTDVTILPYATYAAASVAPAKGTTAHVKTLTMSANNAICACKPNHFAPAAAAAVGPPSIDYAFTVPGNADQITASAPTPANKKRIRDTRDSSLENVPLEKPNTTPRFKSSNKPQSSNLQNTRTKNLVAATTNGKAPVRKIASNSFASSTAEPQPKRTKGFKPRRGPSFQGAEALSDAISNGVPM